MIRAGVSYIKTRLLQIKQSLKKIYLKTIFNDKRQLPMTKYKVASRFLEVSKTDIDLIIIVTLITPDYVSARIFFNLYQIPRN